MSKNKRVETANQAIGFGALAQLSRNGKINNMGGLAIFVGLVTLVGEIIRIPVKWLIVKPCILATKWIWILMKYSVIYGCVLCMTLFQYTYKGIKKLINIYKDKQKEII